MPDSNSELLETALLHVSLFCLHFNSQHKMASASSRPKPRRPRMANASSSNSVQKAGSSLPPASEERDILAEDAMFLRNKNFTVQRWSSLAKNDPSACRILFNIGTRV